jgi:putative ABC transport system substrate-binding protein
MRRRSLIVCLGGVAAWPLAALAQPSGRAPLRIATLSDGNETSSAPLWALFRARLRELGYAEGAGYVIEPRWARGDTKRLSALASELVALKPHVIVTDGTSATTATKRASAQVPIVAMRLSDPVKAGLAASLAKPGANVTGTTVATAQIAGKWIELLREVVPGIKSAAFLTDPGSAGAMITFRELEGHARTLGVRVRTFDGRTGAAIAESFGTIGRERWEALIVGTNQIVFVNSRQILEAAARQRLPAIYARQEYVDAGGLMSYGANLGVHFSRAADYVHRIAQGAQPADLPIEQPTRFDLVVNLKAARALGIRIPPPVLLRADRVIE